MSTDVAIPSYAATLLGGVAIGWALKALLAHGSSSSSAPCACAAACSACAAAAAPAAAAQAPADAKLPEQPPAEELKMVLCVNASLGMSKGKIGGRTAPARGQLVLAARACRALRQRCGRPVLVRIRAGYPRSRARAILQPGAAGRPRS